MSDYLEVRKNYYMKEYVQFELLKAMRDREVTFMDRKDNYKCIRGLWFKSIPFLLKGFEAFKFFEKDYNIYISVAKYKYIPIFTYNLLQRSKETSKWFEEEAKEQIYNYNILLDFDDKIYIPEKKSYIENRKIMLDEIKYVCNLLLDMNLSYYIIPSGSNFQIVMESNLTPEEAKEFIVDFKELYNLKFLDLAGAGADFKIMKCPYSLVATNVCLPLREVNKEALNNYDSYNVYSVLSNITIKHRGIPLIKRW